MEKKTFKAINFDLDTKALKEYYPKSRRNAYREIGKFLKDNGFSHRQWSGYISNIKMDFLEISKLNEKLWSKFPWLEQCANKFDVTDIGKSFDLKLMHQEQVNEDKEIENSSVKNDINFNMSSWRNAVEKPNNSIRAASAEKQLDNSMDIGERE